MTPKAARPLGQRRIEALCEGAAGGIVHKARPCDLLARAHCVGLGPVLKLPQRLVEQRMPSEAMEHMRNFEAKARRAGRMD